MQQFREHGRVERPRSRLTEWALTVVAGGLFLGTYMLAQGLDGRDSEHAAALARTERTVLEAREAAAAQVAEAFREGFVQGRADGLREALTAIEGSGSARTFERLPEPRL